MYKLVVKHKDSSVSQMKTWIFIYVISLKDYIGKIENVWSMDDAIGEKWKELSWLVSNWKE